ncbi:protein-L-isoaspartate O-methyltransferase, partial [Halobacterium sp. PCN9]|nr:protein-L-isoaspartate O-methyltransferase [Halobacterium bonnevillei]
EGTTDQRLVAVEDRETVSVHGPVAFAPLLVDGEQASAVERNRTVREDRERAARAAESRTGWEHEWIDWDGA